jgi:class 3 adenylate cyclase
MSAPSFRLKLLLAMMLVVVGVTGSTLFVTERKVQAGYARLSGEQFASQVRYFTAMQESRLGYVKDRCRELVQSVRLREALRVAELEGEVGLLYQTAEDELRELKRDAGPRRRLTFVRFFDSHGKVLSPPSGANDSSSDRVAVERVPSLEESTLGSAEQAFGFLSWGSREGRDDLLEIIVTPVVDQPTGQALGALMLAFPIPELLERDPAPGQERGSHVAAAGGAAPDSMIMLGLWFGDRLYARPGVLEASDEAALGDRLRSEMGRGTAPIHDFGVALDGGRPFRVFYRAPNPGSRLPMAYQVCLYSLEDAYRDRRELRVGILGFAGLGVAGALGLSFVLSHGLSIPIRDLVSGTREIHRGNLAVRVPVRSRDEIGQLAESFNEMAGGLLLKEKYRTVLNVVADEKIAESLLDGKLELGGELRDVSVLFCDIRGFTALTQNMPPGEVIELLNEHMTALTRVVKTHRGVVDKFVGDLIMAIFGAPVRSDDNARSAADCALRMIESREQLNLTTRRAIRVGIGIATGEAVAGCMGSADRLNYTVLGERVNLASRLCSKAGPMQVVIDETTQARVADRAVTTALEPLELKGIDGPVRAYQLISIERTVLAP